MPFIGLGLHVVVAIFFAVHAMKTGRNLYWLIILFSFPLLGSIVYFLVEYLPHSRLNRGINKAAGAAMKLLDPEREYREASAAYDLTPTAQNKIRLAKAALERGNAQEAVRHYDDALTGPFASDPELLFGLGRSLLAEGSAAAAVRACDVVARLSATHPDYRRDETALLAARAFAGAGRRDEAARAFEHALGTYNNVETRARYIAWLAQQGDTARASTLMEDLQKAARHWSSHARDINREWIALAQGSLKA
ncbi:hypothetical protein [Caenimonas aquaedulcis]|uniref:Tetratricopeptide repeat protein n=1 Tax=Caenimonas aquaedulcis TaxID=2793270 RepID=A0A931H249_9BURK|nr:hypothetical protein [Caenimonas aquaedulcis]MBG9387145.1 hypothetical protein [Caenimonas aquaedulcis]